MTALGHDRFCGEIITQTDLLRATVKGADLGAAVPTCPEWTLDQLVRHVGGNLRTVETAVRTGEAVDRPQEQVLQLTGPPEADPRALDAWLVEAAAAFAETLRKAGPDAEAEVWTVRRSTAFWVRRAVHDVVVHRADAALAVGAEYAVAPELAVDAVDELLDLFRGLQAAGVSPALAELRGPGKSIHLHATDTEAEWLIELGADGFSWRRGHDRATVALRGPLTDVLLVFYRRLPADSGRVEVLGDAGLLNFWLERTSLR
ncbi:MAG TPA: maleylpyruvate isomerase family mycothiol-dependent enzyme [Pilimelia sp.]|nr:maleylpyruvate isomerase family mycothiol-dependent enzyme [Pilimelia sp.]